MSETKENRPTLTQTGMLTAAATFALPWLSDAIIFGASGQGDRIWDAPAVLLGNAVFAMLPFLLVDSAMRPRRRVRIALWIGLASSVALWAFHSYGGYVGQVAKDFSLSLWAGFMVMVWPFVQVIGMGMIAKVGEKDVT
jgi:hypothetical protein